MFAKAPIRRFATSSKNRATAALLLVMCIFPLTGCATGGQSRHQALQRALDATTSDPTAIGPAHSKLRSPATSSHTVAGNDLPLGGPSLSRPAFVRAVLALNPTLRSAQFAFAAALAQYPQSIALDDPTLDYGITPGSIGLRDVDDGHKVELRQRFPFPGKLRLRGEEALAHAEATLHDLQSVRLQLAATASLLFDDYYYLGRAIEINGEHIELLERFKAVSIARYETGNGSQQDPLHAETELAHLIHRDVVLRTETELVSMRMNALLHRSPTHPIPAPPSTLEPPAMPDPGPEPERLALQIRPELLATASHVEAEQSSVAHARREFFPDFTVVAAYNSLLQVDENRAFVGISVNVPLQLGRRRAALRESEAKLGRARAEQERATDEIRLGTARSRARLNEAEHVLMLFRDTLLPPARDRVEAARAGFETGRNSFLALIEAERNLRETSDGLEKARADRSQARTRFRRELGLFPDRIAEVESK